MFAGYTMKTLEKRLNGVNVCQNVGLKGFIAYRPKCINAYDPGVKKLLTD